MHNHLGTVGTLMLVLACGSALADPAGDAPETFEEAVLISPGIRYSGTFELPTDIDYYKFSVEQGGDIAIDCYQRHHTPHAGDVIPSVINDVPCVARLWDPSGLVRDSSPPSMALSFKGAEAGEWRLEVDGANLNDPTHAPLVYYFTVSGNGVESGSPGAGSLAGVSSLLLGGLAFLRGLGHRRALALLRCTGRCLPFLLIGSFNPASADPPDGGDGPGAFAEAARIQPDIEYLGRTAGAGDIDFYTFAVAEGQDIYFQCRQSDDVCRKGLCGVIPCRIRLFDPAGNELLPSGFENLTYGFQPAADAGDWRVSVENGVPSNPGTPEYTFGVSLYPSQIPGGGAANTGSSPNQGGTFDFLAGLLFAAAALARSSRHTLAAAVASVTCKKADTPARTIPALLAAALTATAASATRKGRPINDLAPGNFSGFSHGICQGAQAIPP